MGIATTSNTNKYLKSLHKLLQQSKYSYEFKHEMVMAVKDTPKLPKVKKFLRMKIQDWYDESTEREKYDVCIFYYFVTIFLCVGH